jgi:aromatic-L-amino-acid decarboxylase
METLCRAFSLVPEYLRTSESDAVRNGMDYGIQLGRRFRALKLWMILRYFGHNGLASRLREHCRLARLFAAWVEQSPHWELLAPVPFSLVCFRACPPLEGETEPARAARLDAINERLMNNINAGGAAYLSHTRLHDRFTLRLAIGNIRTTEEHVSRVWELLEKEAARLSSIL